MSIVHFNAIVVLLLATTKKGNITNIICTN